MNELSLLYFDIDGGRAEPIRLALHFGQIEFDDVRFPMKSFPEVKATTPFGQVPTLTVNGQVITQTNAILRFVGQQVGLYPDDLMEALLVDEVLDVVEDMIDKMVATFGMKGEALESARASLLEGSYSRYLEWMSDRLVAQGEGFFAGTELSIADLKSLGVAKNADVWHVRSYSRTMAGRALSFVGRVYNRNCSTSMHCQLLS